MAAARRRGTARAARDARDAPVPLAWRSQPGGARADAREPADARFGVRAGIRRRADAHVSGVSCRRRPARCRRCGDAERCLRAVAGVHHGGRIGAGGLSARRPKRRDGHAASIRSGTARARAQRLAAIADGLAPFGRAHADHSRRAASALHGGGDRFAHSCTPRQRAAPPANRERPEPGLCHRSRRVVVDGHHRARPGAAAPATARAARREVLRWREWLRLFRDHRAPGRSHAGGLHVGQQYGGARSAERGRHDWPVRSANGRARTVRTPNAC